MIHPHMKLDLKTSRIEALSDGIFAFAMTILIIGFEILLTRPKSENEQMLLQALLNVWPDFLHYIEGFVLLGVFWIEHHYQFHFIHRTDPTLLLINIAALMVIALIPFSAVIMGDYGYLRVAAFLLEGHVFVAGLIFYIHWAYATTRRRLVDADLDVHVIEYFKIRNLVIPLTSLVAMGFSYFLPRSGTLLYFAVPVLLALYRPQVFAWWVRRRLQKSPEKAPGKSG